MNINFHQQKGFTLLEVVVTLAIAILIASIGFMSFSNASKVKNLQTIGDSITATLEKAKANSVTGNGGTVYGVKFSPNSYVYFSGNSYSATSSSNVTYAIDSAFTATTTISNNADFAIIFSRLTGAANTTATITVSQITNPAVKKVIRVEPLGSISVIQ